LKKALQGKLLQECFGTLLNPKKSLVNDFEHKFNLSCEIAVPVRTALCSFFCFSRPLTPVKVVNIVFDEMKLI